jgi:formylglycine-generating enzyme required for sulfatase activity
MHDMKNLIQAAVVTLFAASTAQAQQAVQWKVSDGGNGHWYACIRDGAGMTVHDAANRAASAGAHLLTGCSSEFDFAVSAVDALNPAGWVAWGNHRWGPWIGLRRVGSSGDFEWVDGTSCEFDRWDAGAGQPDPSTEDAVLLYSTSPLLSAFCHDIVGSRLTNSAIIEWSADCNGDGIVDYGQILDGTFADADSDGVPDVCQQPACASSDLTANGVVDGADLGALLAFWGPVNPVLPQADIDGNGIVDGADLGTLLAHWGPCGAPAWATVIEWQPDPSVVTDPVLRAAILATGLPWRVRDAGTQIEMLLVPPGTFQMGDVQWAPPAHVVTLTRPYYLGRYEVTQAQWVAKMRSNPSTFQASNGFAGSDARPVDNVSWTMAQQFVSETGFRLPTEAEWEYACRAGTTSLYYNGSDDRLTLDALAWWGNIFTGEGNSGLQTHPVGQKQANRFGFHDMLGNVWEWTSCGSYNYVPGAVVDPSCPPPAVWGNAITRGGSAGGPANTWNWYVCDRGDNSAYIPLLEYGIRVARNP